MTSVDVELRNRRVAEMTRHLSRITQPSTAMFNLFIRHGVIEGHAITRPHATAALTRLVEAQAWTDAAITLQELEAWPYRLRRLFKDGDQWLCSLTRTFDLPIDLDDSVEGRDPNISIAILRAVVAVMSQRLRTPILAPAAPSVATVSYGSCQAIVF